MEEEDNFSSAMYDKLLTAEVSLPIWETIKQKM
jgi:hypothetical protein